MSFFLYAEFTFARLVWEEQQKKIFRRCEVLSLRWRFERSCENIATEFIGTLFNWQSDDDWIGLLWGNLWIWLSFILEIEPRYESNKKTWKRGWGGKRGWECFKGLNLWGIIKNTWSSKHLQQLSVVIQIIIVHTRLVKLARCLI